MHAFIDIDRSKIPEISNIVYNNTTSHHEQYIQQQKNQIRENFVERDREILHTLLDSLCLLLQLEKQ